MESRQKTYLPFLQPLLEAPGSRYRLKDWPDLDIWYPHRFVEEGLLHDAEGNGGPPPTTEEPNNSILIVANLVGRRQVTRGVVRATSTAHSKAIDFSYNVRTRSGFQTYGPTRMLMWISDEEKRPLLPRTVGYRGKLSVSVEASVDLEEVAGFQPALDAKHLMRREDALDIESSKLVAKRMQENGIKKPLHHQARLEDRRTIYLSRKWYEDLQKLEQGFERGDFSQHVRPAVESIDGHIPRAVTDPEYKKLVKLRILARSYYKRIDRIQRVLTKQEDIDKMDHDRHRENITAMEQEEIVKKLDSNIQDYKGEIEKLPEKLKRELNYLDDNRRAFSMDPPLLMWDRRKAEPISAREDDFSPPRQISLVDFQPKIINELPMTTEQSFYFDVISTFLLGSRGAFTLKHLRTIAPGALEALVPQVPAIRDPRRGGRYDIDSVRARTLTPEMIHGLAVAWDNWAFKPPLEEMMTQFGKPSDLELDPKREGRVRIARFAA